MEEAYTGTYIMFKPLGIARGQRTNRWSVIPKDFSTRPIGIVRWFGRWRKYTFEPWADTAFEETCLREIAEFIEARTREQRQRRKK